MSFYPVDAMEASTPAPFKRTVGHEMELWASTNVAVWLAENGHGPTNNHSAYEHDDWCECDRCYYEQYPEERPYGYDPDDIGDGYHLLHGYGCDCEAGYDFAIHPTEDGTAPGGEYLIGSPSGVVFGSQPYMGAIRIFARACQETSSYGTGETGGHVHVGSSDLSGQQRNLLARNYLALQDQIMELAAGPFDEVRSNGCTYGHMDMPGVLCDEEGWKQDWRELDLGWSIDSSTLRLTTGHGTVEFRVWNTSTSAWRIALSGAVSAALVEAASKELVVPGPNAIDLLDHLDGLLTPDMVMLVERQRKMTDNHKEGVR